MCAVTFSHKAMVQATPDIEMLVRRILASAAAQALDKGAIEGTGATNQPSGVNANLLTANTLTLGTASTGDAPTWANLMDTVGLVAESNADTAGESAAWIMRPRAAYGLMRMVKVANEASYLVDSGGMLGRHPVRTTTQIAKVTTKGTTTGLDLDSLYFGDWSEVLLGMWGGVDVLTDPYSGRLSRQITVSLVQNVDLAVRHAASFAAVKCADIV